MKASTFVTDAISSVGKLQKPEDFANVYQRVVNQFDDWVDEQFPAASPTDPDPIRERERGIIKSVGLETIGARLDNAFSQALSGKRQMTPGALGNLIAARQRAIQEAMDDALGATPEQLAEIRETVGTRFDIMVQKYLNGEIQLSPGAGQDGVLPTMNTGPGLPGPTNLDGLE